MVKATTDEILTERRLRSSELALDAARRRLAESEQELAALHERVAELERGIPEPVVIHDPGPIHELQAELAAQVTARRAAEQALHAERDNGEVLTRELARRSTPAVEGVERELEVSQRHARRLETELALVRRHAAEFEYGIRLAVAEAWVWLGEVGDRANGAFRELSDLHDKLTRLPGADLNREDHEPEAELPPGAGDDISAERLDRALARLRASDSRVPPGPPEFESAPPRRRWPWSGSSGV